MKKVYCANCKFNKGGACYHKSNMRKVDTPYKEIEETINGISLLNKNNNCNNFVEKNNCIINFAKKVIDDDRFIKICFILGVTMLTLNGLASLIMSYNS